MFLFLFYNLFYKGYFLRNEQQLTIRIWIVPKKILLQNLKIRIQPEKIRTDFSSKYLNVKNFRTKSIRIRGVFKAWVRSRSRLRILFFADFLNLNPGSATLYSHVRFYSQYIRYGITWSMVLISDGCSQCVVHVLIKSNWNLTQLYWCKPLPWTGPKYPSCTTCAHGILSYHLIYVPWIGSGNVEK